MHEYAYGKAQMFMFRKSRQYGFSLVEVMTAVAVVAILAAMLLGLSKHLRTQANIRLTESMMDVLDTALEQYHEAEGAFPFEDKIKKYMADFLTANPPIPPETIDDVYGEAASKAGQDLAGPKLLLEDVLAAAMGPGIIVTLPANHDTNYMLSEALYFYLDGVAESRRILTALSDTLTTDKGKDNARLRPTRNDWGPPDEPSNEFNLIRFIDPWGTSLRYIYTEGRVFPLLESAGPDKKFQTKGDNITN